MSEGGTLTFPHLCWGVLASDFDSRSLPRSFGTELGREGASLPCEPFIYVNKTSFSLTYCVFCCCYFFLTAAFFLWSTPGFSLAQVLPRKKAKAEYGAVISGCSLGGGGTALICSLSLLLCPEERKMKLTMIIRQLINWIPSELVTLQILGDLIPPFN